MNTRWMGSISDSTSVAWSTGALVQHLLQVSSEYLVAWCVDERIHTKADETQWTGYDERIVV